MLVNETELKTHRKIAQNLRLAEAFFATKYYLCILRLTTHSTVDSADSLGPWK